MKRSKRKAESQLTSEQPKQARTDPQPIKESLQPDEKIFWRRPVKIRTKDNEFLKLENESDFQAGLPVQLDVGYGKDLQRFFVKENEERILNLFEPPGVGKSTTIQVLAQQAGCAYRRFDGTSGLFGAMLNKMGMLKLPQTIEELLQRFPYTNGDLLPKLELISIYTLQAMFNIILEQAKDRKPIFIPSFQLEDKLEFDPVDDLDSNQLFCCTAKARVALKNTVEECLAEMEKIQKFKVLVIHIDDCQSWLPEIIQSNVLHAYKLKAFAKVMGITHYRVRIALTGTSIEADRGLRFETAVKVYNNDSMPKWNIQQVKQLLNIFIDVDKLDEDVIMKIVGPPRKVEFFLKHLYSNQPPQVACNRACSDWEQYYTRKANIVDIEIKELGWIITEHQQRAALEKIYLLEMAEEIEVWAEQEIMKNNIAVTILLASNELDRDTARDMMKAKWIDAGAQSNINISYLHV